MSDQQTKRVHVEIDAEIHHRMRLQAMTEKKTIRAFLESLIESYLLSLLPKDPSR